MAASHKFSSSHIQARSGLSADRVAEISKSVGESTKGNIAIGVNHVRFEGAQAGRTNFSIRGLGNHAEYMTFHVSIDDQRTGCIVKSGIDTFKTRQQKLLMLIPIGPKSMLAYKTYKLFMGNFEAALRAKDPGARTTITERAA